MSRANEYNRFSYRRIRVYLLRISLMVSGDFRRW